MSGVITFLESPLVTWVKTFSLGKEMVTFQDISDAVYLIDVLNAIDERNTDEEVLKKLQRFAKDPNARLQNWGLLIHTLTAYYLEVLQQAIVMKIPDVFSIVEDPTQDKSLAELEKVLLMLLGCAVQCDKKEHHIETIKSLEISAQRELVDCIKQVTDSGENVLTLDSYGRSDDTKLLYLIIRKMVLEKEELFQRMIQLKQERDYHASEVSKKFGKLTPPLALENYHLLRELQGCKVKVQEGAVEIEEKGKTICDLKEELQHSQKEITKVKSEKLKFEKDARLARTYRDEVDSLKEQALKVEKYEKEVTRFKEKVHELDYYKSRVEELREDNSLLCDCKEKLEEQSTATQSQLTSVRQDVDRLEAVVDRLSKEKSELEQKLSDAQDENAALDFEKAQMTDGYPGPLRRMISYTSSEFLQASQQQVSGQPICEELNDSMSSHVTRLEVENGELKHELEQIKSKLYSTQQEVETLLNQSEHDYKRRLQSSDRDTQRHAVEAALERKYDLRLSELRSVISQRQGQLQQCEERLRVSEQSKQGLERQVACMEEQWHSAQTRCQDLNTETKQLKRELQQNRRKLNSIQDTAEQLIVLQRDKEDLVQRLNSLHTQVSREKEQSISIQRDNNDLIQRLSAQQSHWDRDKESCVSLEREKAQLQGENQQLKYDIDSLRECSEQHIKELEDQIGVLQDKSVAIESLNDYLNNLSMVDTVPDIVDTDLDAHLDVSHAKDDNHNDKLSSTVNEKTDWNSQEVAMPKCSTPQSSRRGQNGQYETASSMSLSEADQYAIDSSQLYGNDRPTKITYVKRNQSFNTPSSHDAERSGSNNFINKLKSYVKPYKPVPSKPEDCYSGKNGQRTPLKEVQLREDRNFVRNGRHRNTVHGQVMVEKSPSLKREKLRTPVTHATSRPVSAPFSRSHSHRQTMPERRRMPPSEHKSSSSQHNSSHHSLISQDSVRSRSSSQSSSQHPNNTHCYRDYSSDLDSGLGVSGEQSQAIRNSMATTTGDQKAGDSHNVTSIEIMSTETIESHWKKVSMKSSDKWQGLVDRVKHLEEQNQSLTADNSVLKKSLETRGGNGGSPGLLQKRLQQVEAENRKLRIIVETLQNTLGGRNPYDDKEYHYFTNV